MEEPLGPLPPVNEKSYMSGMEPGSDSDNHFAFVLQGQNPDKPPLGWGGGGNWSAFLGVKSSSKHSFSPEELGWKFC